MSAVALHHVVEGPAGAPPLVLLHSLGMALGMWDRQAVRLSGQWRVVRCDLRGHGRSPVPPGPYDIAELGGDVLALLDRLGVDRAHLCGVSLGAMAALWVAARHPRRVAGLVVCATSARLGPPEAWRERAAVARARGPAALAEVLVQRWFTASFLARVPAPAAVATARAALAATPAEGYAACCEAIAAMDLRPDLAAIRAPTLVIAGGQDQATPLDHLTLLARAIPGARQEVIADAAHLVSLEQPERVSDLIAEHLGQQEKGTSHEHQ